MAPTIWIIKLHANHVLKVKFVQSVRFHGISVLKINTFLLLVRKRRLEFQQVGSLIVPKVTWLDHVLQELTLRMDTRVTLDVYLVQRAMLVLSVQTTQSAVMKVMKLLRSVVVSALLVLITSGWVEGFAITKYKIILRCIQFSILSSADGTM